MGSPPQRTSELSSINHPEMFVLEATFWKMHVSIYRKNLEKGPEASFKRLWLCLRFELFNLLAWLRINDLTQLNIDCNQQIALTEWLESFVLANQSFWDTELILFHNEVYQSFHFQVCNLFQASLLRGTSVREDISAKTLFLCVLLLISQLFIDLSVCDPIWWPTFSFKAICRSCSSAKTPSSILSEMMKTSVLGLFLCQPEPLFHVMPMSGTLAKHHICPFINSGHQIFL